MALAPGLTFFPSNSPLILKDPGQGSLTLGLPLCSEQGDSRLCSHSRWEAGEGILYSHVCFVVVTYLLHHNVILGVDEGLSCGIGLGEGHHASNVLEVVMVFHFDLMLQQGRERESAMSPCLQAEAKIPGYPFPPCVPHSHSHPGLFLSSLSRTKELHLLDRTQGRK